MNEVYEILNDMQDSKNQKVLATIINVEGSSYRKEGAMMLYKEDGKKIGLLSGGCLEEDLLEKAKQTLFEKETCIANYDLSYEDDYGWGQGKGCHGKITVLLEWVDRKLEKHFKQAQKYLSKGIPIYLIKKLSKNGTVIDYMFITQNQKAFGEWDGHTRNEFIHSVSNYKKGMNHLESGTFFIQVFKPKPRLIIFGAGPDVRPLVHFASKTGFQTIVTDWRPLFCHISFFPTAQKTICDYPIPFISEFEFRPDDSIVIMTHHFQRDKEILSALIKKDLKYLGILGPRNRTLSLVEKEEIPSWLHSPVGLPIGAVGPEEIAISICADVIKANRSEEQV